MSKPVIAQRKPYLQAVTAGSSYFWCRCGRSRNQPFCDGSHRGTEFTPVKYVAEADGEVLFCGCKHTGSQPLCDGSHNRLSQRYGEAGADQAELPLVDFVPGPDGASRARLDGGCYVIRVPESSFERHRNLSLYPVIGAPDDARFLSQFAVLVNPGESPVMRFPASDVALFIVSGQGRVAIGGRSFEIGPESGVWVGAGEGIAFANPGPEPIVANLSACPQSAAPEWPERMPEAFDSSRPERVATVDEARRERMGDRFFQVLLDVKTHGTEVTQFIGEIPRSRAAHHRHLYEETLTVLAGEGFMWTDTCKAPVWPGDTIFLPRKQSHSLECTNPGGMRLVGVFYPPGSPAVNY